VSVKYSSGKLIYLEEGALLSRHGHLGISDGGYHHEKFNEREGY
jgi:hypothetical protein